VRVIDVFEFDCPRYAARYIFLGDQVVSKVCPAFRAVGSRFFVTLQGLVGCLKWDVKDRLPMAQKAQEETRKAAEQAQSQSQDAAFAGKQASHPTDPSQTKAAAQKNTTLPQPPL
jgi:hypothetical protein